ncbi:MULTISPECIES: AraC family transcriptional regulator [unclassified Pseudomonas]|nr:MULTISPECIES: AraC family transcriptional regulator [unclassified Pseudomonas]
MLFSTSEHHQHSFGVGYDSPGHFAQVFRRHMGMTPRQYRQK